jgi:phage terminase Nu1 subunit (DNA packaging protein)
LRRFAPARLVMLISAGKKPADQPRHLKRLGSFPATIPCARAAPPIDTNLCRSFRTKVQPVTQKFISTGELAQRLGLSSRRVATLASEGVITRTPKGFDEADAIRCYAEHMRRAAVGKRGDGKASGAGEERQRLARLQGDALERKNAIEAGKLVVAAEIEAEWTATVVACRNAILAAPTRIQSDLPHLTAHDVATIDRHLREALTLLGASSS